MCSPCRYQDLRLKGDRNKPITPLSSISSPHIPSQPMNDPTSFFTEKRAARGSHHHVHLYPRSPPAFSHQWETNFPHHSYSKISPPSYNNPHPLLPTLAILSLLPPSSICYTHKLTPSACPVNTIISSIKNKDSWPRSPLPHSLLPCALGLKSCRHSLSHSSTLILSQTF